MPTRGSSRSPLRGHCVTSTPTVSGDKQNAMIEPEPQPAAPAAQPALPVQLADAALAVRGAGVVAGRVRGWGIVVFGLAVWLAIWLREVRILRPLVYLAFGSVCSTVIAVAMHEWLQSFDFTMHHGIIVPKQLAGDFACPALLSRINWLLSADIRHR